MNPTRLHYIAAFVMLQAMNRKLYKFLHTLTGEQQERFATLAKTTVGTIRHYVTERRHASAQSAIDMEKAATRLRAQVEGVPALGRGDLCAACKGCEYRKRCVAEDKEDLS